MRCARFLRGGLGLFLAGLLLGSAGCTHTYYVYGNGAPPCAPELVPGTVSSGAVCDVPAQPSSANTVVQGTARTPAAESAPLTSTARPPRVVVSEPKRGLLGRWQPVDSSRGVATTRVEGNVADPTTIR